MRIAAPGNLVVPYPLHILQFYGVQSGYRTIGFLPTNNIK